MPTTEAGIKSMLSSAFKTDVMENSLYGLPTAPLTYSYTHDLLATYMAVKVGLFIGASIAALS